MNTTIKTELQKHILDYINDGTLTNDNQDEWHFYAFNEDYYIIGTDRAKEWLKTHSLNAFEAIDIVRDYETEHFGEFTTDIHPESIVNMLAYIYGEEVLCSYDVETVEELESQIVNEILNIEIVEKVGTEIYSTEKDFVFFNVVNKTEVSNFIFTNDYPRYRKKYDKCYTTETVKNI